MAYPTFNNAVLGETFLPGQIFVFGGFALRANSLGHLEQIESYTLGHQVRFGSLNYMADICGDLIVNGFEPLPCAPRGHDEYDLALPSDHIQEISPAAAPSLNSEPVAPSMDGWIDPVAESVSSAPIEPNIDLTLHESRVTKLSDPSPATDSEPPAPVPIESDWAPIMEFTSADIFQHSPFGDILNSLRSLSPCQEDPGRTMSDRIGMRMTKKFSG